MHYSVAAFITLAAFFFPSVQFLAFNKQKPSQLNRNNEERNTEKALNRTLAKLRKDGENGRLVLLMCHQKCIRQRAQIPNWVREFNEKANASILKRRQIKINKNMSMEELTDDESQQNFEEIAFHYHFHTRPIPEMDIESALNEFSSRQSALFYIVGGKAFPATPEGISTEKNSFLSWLDSFEHPPIIRISESVQMNEWLNSECHGEGLNRRRSEQEMVLLVVHDKILCPEPLLSNFARSLSAVSRQQKWSNSSRAANITVLEAIRPISESADLSLYARLPGLSHHACRLAILLRANLFTELPPGILGSEIHQTIENWVQFPLATQQCPGGNSSLNLAPILGPLGAANLEFLREERILKAIEKKREYLTVGIIGGIAVMALAMSIFLGLNGNDFVTKQ